MRNGKRNYSIYKARTTMRKQKSGYKQAPFQGYLLASHAPTESGRKDE